MNFSDLPKFTSSSLPHPPAQSGRENLTETEDELQAKTEEPNRAHLRLPSHPQTAMHLLLFLNPLKLQKKRNIPHHHHYTSLSILLPPLRLNKTQPLRPTQTLLPFNLTLNPPPPLPPSSSTLNPFFLSPPPPTNPILIGDLFSCCEQVLLLATAGRTSTAPCCLLRVTGSSRARKIRQRGDLMRRERE